MKPLFAAMSAAGIFTLLGSAFGKKKEIVPGSELIRVAITKGTVRDAIVANALWCVGIEAANPNKLPLFVELLGPPPAGESWEKFLSLPYGSGGISTCGVVAEGIYRRVGCDLGDLQKPYVPGMAISRMLSYAGKIGALRKPSSGLPKRGDYVVIGDAATNALHVLIPVQDVTSDGCASVDGGQVGPKGLQAIYRLERSVRKGEEPTIGKRPIYRYVDASAIGLVGSGLVPRGWR